MTYTGSIRCEGDTWDLASSVGATATMVAAARAMATRAANPLINDQFAEPLVRAVGVDVLTRLASGELTASDIDDPERPNASMVPYGRTPCRPHQVLRRVLHGCDTRGHQARS